MGRAATHAGRWHMPDGSSKLKEPAYGALAHAPGGASIAGDTTVRCRSQELHHAEGVQCVPHAGTGHVRAPRPAAACSLRVRPVSPDTSTSGVRDVLHSFCVA